MNFPQFQEIMDRVKYKDWTFRLMEKGDGFLLQVVFMAKDTQTGEVCEQRGRKWYISSHACTNEVVTTAWKAVTAAEEHEVKENFKYRGVRIFNPHLDPDSIVDAWHSGKLCSEYRDDPTSH